MKTILAAVAMLIVALPLSAHAQSNAQPPPQCQGQQPAQIDWQACFDASPADAQWRPLALINLATDAFLRQDYQQAQRLYDEAIPPRSRLLSDVTFHTFRGATYRHVGRQDEARADADIAWRMLHFDPTLPIPRDIYMPAGLSAEDIYVYLLPIWQSGDTARFETALAEFRALPAVDWISFANRAAALEQVGDLAGSLEMSSRALALAPDHPNILNNHCYILHRANRSVEALPYCERAVSLAPESAAARDPLSDVLATLGRCEEADREIALARRLDPSSPNYREPIACAAN